MSFSHRIEHDPDLLVIIGEGMISQAERLASMREWMSDPAYKPGIPTLFDISRTDSTPTMSELHEVVEIMMHNAVAIGRKKLAVVTSKPITHGVARQFAMLAAPLPLDIEVFSSQEAALAWIFGT